MVWRKVRRRGRRRKESMTRKGWSRPTDGNRHAKKKRRRMRRGGVRVEQGEGKEGEEGENFATAVRSILEVRVSLI